MGNQNLSYTRFNLYWPTETINRKDMLVFIAVRKDILSQIIIEHQINLISHLYCMALDIKKLQEKLRKYIRKIRIVILYNDKVEKGQL